MGLQFTPNRPKALVFFPQLVKKEQNDTPAWPSTSFDGFVHQLLRNLRRHPMRCAAMVMNLLVLVLYLQGNVKIYYLQAKAVIDKNIFGLDIPMGDRSINSS